MKNIFLLSSVAFLSLTSISLNTKPVMAGCGLFGMMTCAEEEGATAAVEPYDGCSAHGYVFEYRYYLNSYPDLQRAFGQNNCSAAFKHWNDYGIKEGRQGHPNFSSKCYLARYPDLQQAFGVNNYSAALQHYSQYGIKEKRDGKC
jgi:hypothetical protein